MSDNERFYVAQKQMDEEKLRKLNLFLVALTNIVDTAKPPAVSQKEVP